MQAETSEPKAPQSSARRLSAQPDPARGADAGFPPAEILVAARAHFSNSKIGAPEKYEQPFTVQLKNDTRRHFPIDDKYYALAEAAQSSVLLWYLLLQLIEVLLLSALVLVQAALFATDRLPRWLEWSPMSNISFPIAASAAAAAAAAFVLARRSVRWYFFHQIERKAERLSFDVFKRIDDISTNVTDACLKSRNRKGRGEWSERARDWIVVALWNAKRGEYLDRFITTTIWAVRTYIIHIEVAGAVGKILVSALAAWIAFDGSSSAAAVISFAFAAALFAQAVGLWMFWGRKPADFWTRVFRASANEHEEVVEPYTEKVASVVENLVHEALGKEFGAGGKKD